MVEKSPELVNLDHNYALLTSTTWKGSKEQAIQWSRDGDNAVGIFGSTVDAAGFVRGALEGPLDNKGFLGRDERGQIRPKRAQKPDRNWESLGDTVHIPQLYDQPVTVRIPLAILDPAGLGRILEIAPRRAQERAAPAADSASDLTL